MPDSRAIADAAACLAAGELVAFPTETVYGLGADAANPGAIAKIFALKGRPADHPLIVHIADATRLGDWARDIPDSARRLAEAFWPGPLTLILNKRDDIAAVVTDASSFALDPIIDGAFAGKPAELETAFAKAMAAGTNPNSIMFAAQRQASQLHKARLAIDEGQGADTAVERNFPRLHFSRKESIALALRNLSAERLSQSILQIGDATLEVRRRPQLAEAIAQRAPIARDAAALAPQKPVKPIAPLEPAALDERRAVIEVERQYERPRGILWDHLQPPQIREIPVLERMGYA